MKAMILAAGLGSRLGALTKSKPKCLMEAGGQTLLAHVITKLKAAGVNEFIINTHYLAPQVEAYLEEQNHFDVSITLVYETDLLDTGGGLKNAQQYFAQESAFILHNADIYCELDIARMLQVHQDQGAIATLAVQDRTSSRKLLFSNERLVGLEKRGSTELFLPKLEAVDSFIPLGFNGIHILSPKVFEYFDQEQQVFSIIDTYKRAAAAGAFIGAHRIDDDYWVDIGTPEKLQSLQERLSTS